MGSVRKYLRDSTPGPIAVETLSGTIPPHPASNNRLLLVDEQKMFDIEKPHHNDVLSGRGVTTNRHPGNESFRGLVGLNKELYVSSTKREKMGISRSIVQAVRSLDPPGRFLDKDPATLVWHDIGHKRAVEKTSQALRDGAAMLRKQLSADIGDPDFLNGVFSEDGTCNSNKEAAKKKKKKGVNEKAVIKTNGKENNKEFKGNSSDKVKVIKAKPLSAKKEHRRVKSNPSELAMATSSKTSRRFKTHLQDEPRTPRSNVPSWSYNTYPPSPHSPGPPPPPHTRSLPNSPMTWGGGPPLYPKSHVSYLHHSPHHLPPHSPYNKPSNLGSYSRSRSFDYYNRPSDPGLSPRCRSWSPYENSGRHNMRYHHQHSHEHYHHHHPPPPPLPPTMHPPFSPTLTRSSTPPSPTSSSGSLPTGRYKYSPGDYYSKPPPTDPCSPRHLHRHSYEAYDSPHHHQHPSPQHPPHHDEYTPERSCSWTPRSTSPHHHHDHYYDPNYPDTNESSEGLSVPCLGEAGRSSQGRFSSKLHLAPRSGRPMIRRQSLTPSQGYDRQQDFIPPTPNSPRYQRSNENSRYYHCDRVEEEKKTSDMDEKIAIAYHSCRNDILTNPKVKATNPLVPSLRPEPIKSESRSSPDEEEMESEYPQVGAVNKDKDQNEYRASPGTFIPVKGDKMDGTMGEDNNSEGQQVDDISMSPLPYDHEDPVTLLDLPDDILTLPISSCGPHDDPACGPHDDPAQA